MFQIDSALYPYIGLILVVWAGSRFVKWLFEAEQWRYDHPRKK